MVQPWEKKIFVMPLYVLTAEPNLLNLHLILIGLKLLVLWEFLLKSVYVTIHLHFQL